MNRQQPPVPISRSTGAGHGRLGRLLLLVLLLPLAGCATYYNDHYYAYSESYYPASRVDRTPSAHAAPTAYGAGLAAYPYWSLDYFYFSSFYTPYSVHVGYGAPYYAPYPGWVYGSRFRHHRPFLGAYGHGYGYRSGYGYPWFGHGLHDPYYSFGFFVSAPLYGHAGRSHRRDRPRDQRRAQLRSMDQRMQSLAERPRTLARSPAVGLAGLSGEDRFDGRTLRRNRRDVLVGQDRELRQRRVEAPALVRPNLRRDTNVSNRARADERRYAGRVSRAGGSARTELRQTEQRPEGDRRVLQSSPRPSAQPIVRSTVPPLSQTSLRRGEMVAGRRDHRDGAAFQGSNRSTPAPVVSAPARVNAQTPRASQERTRRSLTTRPDSAGAPVPAAAPQPRYDRRSRVRSPEPAAAPARARAPETREAPAEVRDQGARRSSGAPSNPRSQRREARRRPPSGP
ncbi:MAG: hypothetical protein RQ729_13135 [Wenzhouxiangellaceae bacterium]|nr:hypothetical protein [Wenzhouxiangellaceae bacterium]